MTKVEYLTRECHKTCGEGICDVNCPNLRDMANAWDACEQSLKERATALYKEGKIDSYALGLLFKEEQHPVDAGRAKAKEKH